MTLMHISWRAPELSATLSGDWDWIIPPPSPPAAPPLPQRLAPARWRSVPTLLPRPRLRAPPTLGLPAPVPAPLPARPLRWQLRPLWLPLPLPVRPLRR